MAALASAAPVPAYAYSIQSRPHARALRPNASNRPRAHQVRPAEKPKQHYNRPSDSSDDEDLAPIKLSAEAQAILGEEQSQAQQNKENIEPEQQELQADHYEEPLHHHHISAQIPDGSPVLRAYRPSPPVVLVRDGSFAYKVHDKSRTFGMLDHESKTPAPRLRKIRVSGSRSQTKSPSSAGVTTEQQTHIEPDEERSSEDIERDLSAVQVAEAADHDPHTVARPRKAKENGAHSTVRTHKMGTGTLLRGAVRRGVFRRQSDDEDSHLAYKESVAASPEMQRGRRAQVELDNKPDDLLFDYESPKSRTQESPVAVNDHGSGRRSASPASQQSAKPASPRRPLSLATSIGRRFPTPALDEAVSSKSSGSNRPMFRIPSLPPSHISNEQENEPPPTFKRGKPAATHLEIHEDNMNKIENKQQKEELVSRSSPQRQMLAVCSNNTPHRPAPPPPPKMSLVEAATSNAGNSRAKKSVHYVLNGRTYRRLDCIGRGGSSRVFRIMAENYKIFALKRVNLEEADMASIAGFKGEIELLKKLENVDRVIRLFDYEVNEEKGVLSVMMELGETDFNKMLNDQLKNENSNFDITFTRHYWKEMLECVQAIHDHDIVHSDLKPANFLLVKGQLKLIDFGIANAIQENTVNVHRENQIGTPNYMSPESLVCHAPIAGQATNVKILKLGKPSDVWSLGCILYQMTYGQPPFAHIPKAFERIMAIPNPEVEIQFPSTGIGGSVVPFGLIKTLKRCLQRDQALRPTIKELLSNADPFLNPVAISPDMLGRVIGNVINHCRKREESYRQSGELGKPRVSCLPRDEDMRNWPQAFYDKLRQAQEEGTAW